MSGSAQPGTADQPRPITMVWAQARDRVIGDGTGMPWRVPADLAHFSHTTMGGACIMGRATWESIPLRFRPFEGRRTIVCTSDDRWAHDPANAGAERAASLEEALEIAHDDPVFICGGGQIYAAALPFAHACIVTEFDARAPGSVRAPALPADEWELVDPGEWITDPRSRVDGWEGPVPHRFTRWERRH